MTNSAGADRLENGPRLEFKKIPGIGERSVENDDVRPRKYNDSNGQRIATELGPGILDHLGLSAAMGAQADNS
jgi:hypothetical protein